MVQLNDIIYDLPIKVQRWGEASYIVDMSIILWECLRLFVEVGICILPVSYLLLLKVFCHINPCVFWEVIDMAFADDISMHDLVLLSCFAEISNNQQYGIWISDKY